MSAEMYIGTEQEEEYYTYEDYLSWPDYPRYELIDGVPYMLAAPTPEHQRILGELHVQFHAFLKGKTCQVFLSPFDVRLKENPFNDTIVQPDLLVVCDKNKITKKGCEGAPDLVIEIESPSSGKMDKMIKFNRYLQAGVREYWIVDPDAQIVQVHLLHDGKYITSPYGSKDTIPVHVLSECKIDLSDVFPPQEEEPVKEGPKMTAQNI
jgi:Uma2 family endonuclease